MKKLLISVVIPSYNEMANLQKGVLDKVVHYLSKQKYDYEVIVVDDGSTDGSRELVKNFTKDTKHIRLIENDHMGKAGAVTTGVLDAKGDYILFTDMDQATPIEELDKFMPYVEKEVDVIIGWREKRKGAPWSRQVMSKGAVVLRSMLIGLPMLHDTQCGFKLFKRKAAMEIFSKLKKIHNGFKAIKGSSVTSGFDVELLYIAMKRGYQIKEVPVTWLYVETRRVSPLKDSIDGVLDLIKIRQNIMRGVYS